MKKFTSFSLALMFLVLSGILTPGFGQTLERIVIDNGMNTAVCVDAADVIGDSTLELLVTNYYDSEIIMYEYDAPDWSNNIIDNVGASFAYFGDMDNDDTLDVVACLWGEKKLVWYENDHPDWTQHMINENTEYDDWILLSDFNGDDTLDVITAPETDEGDIKWYENTSSGWIEHIIDADVSGVAVLRLCDIDDDGIDDVVATMQFENDVVWYKQEGDGLIWTKYIIEDNLIHAFGLNYGDINGDDKVDILVTTGGPYYTGSEVIWYENDHPTWNKHVVDNQLPGATQPYVADVNADGKMDIIATGFTGDDVVWYENDHPTWNKNYIDKNLDGPRTGIITDIEGDGIEDLILPGISMVAWYKIILIDNVNSLLSPGFSVYPNPTSSFLHIEADEPGQHSVEVTSLNGQLIQSTTMDGYSKQIDFSQFSDGTYFITLKSKNFARTEKVIKQ